MKVVVVSESEFFPKGHGVHTAYLNQVIMLRALGVNVYVNSLRRADITHIHTVGPFGLYKLLNSKPTVVSAHVIPASLIGSLIGQKYWFGITRKYLRFFYNRASLVLAVAPHVKEELQKLGVRSRIEIFPNVISTTIFRKDAVLREEGRKRLGLKPKDKVVLGVGQVQERKGVEDFVALAKEFPQVIFIWAGGQPFQLLTAQGEALKRILKNPPQNVRFVEGIPYEEMPGVYNSADIFFFPSYQENAAMAIIEAAACGLPLILRDLIEYRTLYKKGYLPGKNNGEFKAHIAHLFSDSTFFEQSGKESVALAEEFSYKSLGQKLLGYYKSLF